MLNVKVFVDKRTHGQMDQWIDQKLNPPNLLMQVHKNELKQKRTVWLNGVLCCFEHYFI